MADPKYDFGADYDDSYNTRNTVSKGVLNFNKIKNSKVMFFALKDGDFPSLDIIPYVIKTANHPKVVAGKKKIGGVDYHLDLWVHKKVGPGELTVVCLKQNYGRACPICEAAQRLKEEGRKEEFDNIKAKRICYYNVIDHDHPEKGIQVFQYSHWLFEAKLIDQAYNGNKDGSRTPFADPINGYTVEFRGKKVTTGVFSCTTCEGLQFKKRAENLERFVAQAISFDEVLVVYTAEELETIMAGGTIGILDDSGEPDTDGEFDHAAATEVHAAAPQPAVVPAAPVVAPRQPDNPCPKGHDYGIDNDKFPDDCNGCPNWKPCAKASP